MMKAINNKQHKDLVVAAAMSMCKTHGDKKMKKILLDGDIAVIDGKEFTTEQIKTFLTERIVLKRQLETVKNIAKGEVIE